MVGPIANMSGDVLFVARIRTVGVGRSGRHDLSDTDQRIHREQNEKFTNQTDEEQRRTRQIDERTVKRDESVEIVRVGAQFRGASAQNTRQGN